MPQAEVRLTKKQKQVLDLLEGGARVGEVAKRMKVSEAAVYGHMRNIRKAGATLPAERFEPTNGAPAVTNGRQEPPAIRNVREQLEAELAEIDRQRGRVVAAIRVLAA